MFFLLIVNFTLSPLQESLVTILTKANLPKKTEIAPASTIAAFVLKRHPEDEGQVVALGIGERLCARHRRGKR